MNHLALDDRANLEPPSKEPPASTVSTSIVTNNPNSMSSSNNINYADLHYVKKRKLRSQVDDQAPSTSTGNAGAGGASASGNSNLNDKNGLFTFSISLRFFISEFDYKKKKSGRELLEGKKLLKRNLTFVLLLFIFTSFLF